MSQERDASLDKETMRTMKLSHDVDRLKPNSSGRLLVLACSRRKRPEPHPLPAIERYDGPAYRVLRRYLHAAAARPLETHIISAEYGLLPSDHKIPTYDRIMTADRARQLRPEVLSRLSKLAIDGSYKELFICMGSAYLLAIDGLNRLIPPSLIVNVASGALGRQLGQLYDWLNGSPPPQPTARSVLRVTPCLRGVEVIATAADALALARQALDHGAPGLDAYHSWYVAVDDRRVAPKWLASQISGLPVGSFSTDDARRLLAELGVDVGRVLMEGIRYADN